MSKETQKPIAIPKPTIRHTVLTGVTTTGTPHLGNYAGAIRPAIAASHHDDANAFYFLADYHALVKNQSPESIHQSSLEIAATWLALGLDVGTATFYRQSDIPEIPELMWILNAVTAKGLMNRAHAYKAAVASNEDSGSRDPDKGITMALFSYPVLMAADILLFRADRVPVGKDQKQHVEMARDIAQRFNHNFAELFVLPEAIIDENTAVLSGLDGRKMSKSYNNCIYLSDSPDTIWEKLRTMMTDPQRKRRNDPGDPELSPVYAYHKIFSSESEIAEVAEGCRTAGIGCIDCKGKLTDHMLERLAGIHARRPEFASRPDTVWDILREGSKRARAVAQATMDEVRTAMKIDYRTT